MLYFCCAGIPCSKLTKHKLLTPFHCSSFYRFGSPAIGLGILRSKSPTLSKPPFGTILVELRNGMYRTTRLLWVVDPLDLYNFG